MQKKIQQAIVLRSYLPYKQKLALFDYELGRIEIIAAKKKLFDRITHASLISYLAEEWNSFYRMHDYELSAVPESWAHTDIYFLHQLLELSMFFLPLHTPQADKLFELFMLLYQPCLLRTEKELFKKIFLCRFFALIGMYPDNSSFYSSSFFRLISEPIDIMLDVQMDKAQHAQLVQWIYECINIHPEAHHLKTSKFLKENGFS